MLPDDDRAVLFDMLGFAREEGDSRMRNIIAHEYGQVDIDQLWQTVRRDAPRLVAELEAIVAKLPEPD